MQNNLAGAGVLKCKVSPGVLFKNVDTELVS